MSLDENLGPDAPVAEDSAADGFELLLEGERLIAVAVGMIMVRFELSYAQARVLLEGMGGDQGRTLPDVARAVVLGGTPSAGMAVQARSEAGEGVERLSRRLDDSVPARLLDLLVETTDLRQLLRAVAQMATETVPGCVSASIAVVHREERAMIAPSDPRASAIDEAQYGDGRGPGVDAARCADVVRIDDVRAVPPEHAWRQVALAGGITAVMAVPVPSAANVPATLNLYTARATGWPQRSLIAGEALASYAGDAITVAYRMTRRDPSGLYYRPQLG